jgi:hypothetical protein
MIKSDNPDLLVNIFTKEREHRCESIQCWLGLWMGIRMEPLLMGRSQLRQLNNRRNAILIDLIDAKKKN